MTYALVTGAFTLWCTLRPSHATTWCLAPGPYLWYSETDPHVADRCRACQREMAASTRRVTRDLKRGEA